MNRQVDDDLRAKIAALRGVRLDTLIVHLAGLARNAPVDWEMRAFWGALCAVAEDVDQDISRSAQG
ncbi:hypothetical protein [Streptomyces sp. NPDC059909]|uniref:hypothetical protein n=1 Tax=Streptomyces sp. NPDC059909 TaxID=3346998 RepID=UPI00365E4630